MRIRFVAFAFAAAAAIGILPAWSQGTARATEILAGARKAIGDRKLDGLKTLAVQATVQRNVGSMQLNSETELLLELPDKYVRFDAMSGPMNATSTLGFNGDKPLQHAGMPAGGGGGLVIRMGPGPATAGPMQKLTPEEQDKADRAFVRSMRQDLSRLMLGWFATTHPAVHAQYAYVGEAESPDGKAYVIDAKGDEGFTARLFLDEQTQLPLMVTYQGPQPRIVTAGGPGSMAGGRGQAATNRSTPPSDEDRRKMRDAADKQMQELQKEPPVVVEFTLFFDEWRDVDGIRFPHRIRRAMAGTTNEEWTVSKVKVNPRIDARKFEG